jgi:cytochrome P450
LTPGFHFQILEKFVTVIDQTTEILVQKLNENLENFIDVYPLAGLFALDTVCGK